MLLQVLSCEPYEGAGRVGWSLTPGSRWLRLHRRSRRHCSARTALPSPLWAVHFADRLAFGPVGLFLRSLHSRHLGAAGQRDDVSLTGGSYMGAAFTDAIL